MEVGYRSVETGELVIRFFGMKDSDTCLTSYNFFPGKKTLFIIK